MTTDSIDTAKALPKKESRVGLVVAVVVIVGAMAGAAYFQEEIGYFFNLQAWDGRGPAGTVERFLTAAKQGDQQAASQYVKIDGASPLKRSGKWLGWVIPAGITSTEVLVSDLVSDADPKATKTDFVFKGQGRARAWVPGATGTPIRYWLGRETGTWKITSIDAGRSHK